MINIEVTNYATQGDGLEAAVAGVVRTHPTVADRVMYSSFSPQTLGLLMQHTPDVPRGFLHHPSFHTGFNPEMLAALKLTFDHPHFASVNAEHVAQQRVLGMGVNTWTVNDPEVILRMRDLGVAGIMGDSPVNMLRVLGNVAFAAAIM